MKGKKAFLIEEDLYITEGLVEEDQNRKQAEEDEREMLQAFRRFAGAKFDFLAE